MIFNSIDAIYFYQPWNNFMKKCAFWFLIVEERAKGVAIQLDAWHWPTAKADLDLHTHIHINFVLIWNFTFLKLFLKLF